MDVNGNSISDRDFERVRNRLETLCKSNLGDFKTRLMAFGYINELFKMIGIQAIIVGGTAVGIYTTGHYQTLDLDIPVDTVNLDASFSVTNTCSTNALAIP
jgi:hypothetical protein